MNTNELINKFEELYSPDTQITAYAGWSIEKLAVDILELNPEETEAEEMAGAVITTANRKVAASLMGSIRSERKAASSRVNGKLGGRPKKE